MSEFKDDLIQKINDKNSKVIPYEKWIN